MNIDEGWRNLLLRKGLSELEGFGQFDNDLVANKDLSLGALIDNQSASKERENNEDDEITSLRISTPRVCDVSDA